MPYVPAAWLPGPHLMTVYASLARPLPRPRGARERLELPDGDFLDLDRFECPANKSGAHDRSGRGRSEPGASGAEPPILMACHGLEGSSRAGYVRGLVALALARGWSAAALHFRGCSGTPNRLARFYHSGDTADLALAVERLAAERPGRPILLAGFSLGGNVVAKWFGERGDALPPEVRAGAVISAPFDLDRSCAAIDGPGLMNRVYRERFLRGLRRKALAKAGRFPGAIDAARVRAARTLRAFDAAVTAPLHGFSSAEDYYARASSGPGLATVRRPLLAIAAEDDPMVPAAALPVAAARANPCFALEVSARGGHVAFVAGAPWRPSFFAEARAVEFLAGHAHASGR